MSFDITNNLNDKILDIINRCSYDMYVIHKYTNIQKRLDDLSHFQCSRLNNTKIKSVCQLF